MQHNITAHLWRMIKPFGFLRRRRATDLEYSGQQVKVKEDDGEVVNGVEQVLLRLRPL